MSKKDSDYFFTGVYLAIWTQDTTWYFYEPRYDNRCPLPGTRFWIMTIESTMNTAVWKLIRCGLINVSLIDMLPSRITRDSPVAWWRH